MDSLSAHTYSRVLNAANQHVLRGLSNAGGEDRDETICQLADREFDAKRRRHELEEAIAGLPFDRSERILSAVWGVVGAHIDAAFTFGAVATVQATHPLNIRSRARQARRASTATRRPSRR